MQSHNLERVKEARELIKEVVRQEWDSFTAKELEPLGKALEGMDKFLEGK